MMKEALGQDPSAILEEITAFLTSDLPGCHDFHESLKELGLQLRVGLRGQFVQLPGQSSVRVIYV